MKHGIQKRIFFSFLSSIILIVIIAALSLFYLSHLSSDIDQIIRSDIITERSAEKIRSLLINLKTVQTKYFNQLEAGEDDIYPKLAEILSELEKELDNISKLSLLKENRTHINKIIAYQQDYKKIILEFSGDGDDAGHDVKNEIRSIRKKLTKLINEMNQLVSDFLSFRYEQLELHQKSIETLIAKANRNMVLFSFIAVFAGIVMSFVAPQRVTAPFKKYIHAIDQIEDLKLDTRLPLSGDDEVTHLGKAINRMIDRFQTFDEIKIKRIRFEKRKQQVLANMLDLGVIMVSIEGDILFLNAQLAKILDLETDDYQSKNFHIVKFTDEIKEMISQALKSKEKVDSRMMILQYRENGDFEPKAIEALVDVGLVRNHQGQVVNLVITFEDITNPPGESVFKRISISEQALV